MTTYKPGDSVTVILPAIVVEDDGGTVAVDVMALGADFDVFPSQVTSRNVVVLTDMEVRTVAALAMAQRDALLRAADTPLGRNGNNTQTVLIGLANLNRILIAVGAESESEVDE